MNSFAASRKWSWDSEWVFTNWLNFRPTSMGKHNFMGHLLPCAIDSKTNHPPVYLQWIGKFVISTEPHHVISIGPRQPEVPGERAKDSICVSQCQSIKITPKNMYIAWARAQFKIKTHRCAFQTGMSVVHCRFGHAMDCVFYPISVAWNVRAEQQATGGFASIWR